jgi:macrodomain Ter protein organizer (MatP/YcbG family)
MASEKENKETKPATEEGVDLNKSFDALSSKAEKAFRGLEKAGRKLQKYVVENESKFTRPESIQLGYSTLGRVAAEIEASINITLIESLTAQLEETIERIQKKEGF